MVLTDDCLGLWRAIRLSLPPWYLEKKEPGLARFPSASPGEPTS
jgi:hypothetical protein